MPLSSEFAATRSTLHRVATHVVARRRHAVTGRFGLRASPGGFATPAFGDGPEVVRVSNGALVRETGSGAEYAPLDGSTLRRLATFVGVDLGVEFSVGRDTPALGQVDEPLVLDAGSLAVLADWYASGWQALDAVVALLPADSAPAVVQLWPEHFDAATHVGVGPGTGGEPTQVSADRRCNLGVSPGDAFSDEPYVYVGPWGDERPGDAAYWNAPFGAVLRWSDVGADADASAVRTLTRFFLGGLGQLGMGPLA
jgi:hypothetical protein